MIKVGDFVHVSDPYFVDDKNMCVTIPNMLAGNYQFDGSIVYVDEEWGNRVSKIWIMHESISVIPDVLKEIGSVGVDSASCGFFNEEFKQLVTVTETYDNWMDEHKAQQQKKEEHIPRITENENWVITDQTAIAWAGLGDGEYKVRAGKNTDGKIVYVEIDFDPIEEARQVAEIYGI